MAARAVALNWTSPPFPQQFELFKGEAALLTFTRIAVAAITSWTLTFNLKRFHGDATALLTVTPSITDATNGVFTVALTTTHTGTTLATVQTYCWDVWRTDSGSEQLVSYGLLTLLEEVRL